jgi:hypothetical protein
MAKKTSPVEAVTGTVGKVAGGVSDIAGNVAETIGSAASGAVRAVGKALPIGGDKPKRTARAKTPATRASATSGAKPAPKKKASATSGAKPAAKKGTATSRKRSTSSNG